MNYNNLFLPIVNFTNQDIMQSSRKQTFSKEQTFSNQETVAKRQIIAKRHTFSSRHISAELLALLRYKHLLSDLNQVLDL